jgi:hypothetical protein
MVDAGLLDEVMDRVDAGGLSLTGEGGFLPEMVTVIVSMDPWRHRTPAARRDNPTTIPRMRALAFPSLVVMDSHSSVMAVPSSAAPTITENMNRDRFGHTTHRPSGDNGQHASY